MKKKWIAIVPAAIAAFLAFLAVGGAVVWWLWNWLLPPLAGWPRVTYWQALALLALCRILFGGWGRHGLSRSYGRRRMAEHMAERMTPEERERLRQRMRERFGFDLMPKESKPD